MVDILCAVLSGGKWGPTVDGFTTNKLQAAFAGSADGDAAVEGGGGSSKVRAADEEEEYPVKPQQCWGDDGPSLVGQDLFPLPQSSSIMPNDHLSLG